jgi:probable phosphoglycerate mutase
VKTLYLIRHGQTQWNVQRRMQGRLDSPLTEAGIEQAHAHGRLLKEIAGITSLLVSPSGRTRETAYIINSYLHGFVDYAEELLERDMGEWSGMTMDEVSEAFPAAFRARQDDPFHFTPPAGENLADMGERVAMLLDDVLASDHDEVALVTHQVMSRVILSRLFGLDVEQTNRLVHPNDVVYRIDLSSAAPIAAHFLMGDGPRSGLLQHSDDETIARLDSRDTDHRS